MARLDEDVTGMLTAGAVGVFGILLLRLGRLLSIDKQTQQ